MDQGRFKVDLKVDFFKVHKVDYLKVLMGNMAEGNEHKGSILVVDDEADIRQQVAGILADEGHDVREAATSSDALAELARRRPGLLIIDVWLGDSQLNGLELLARIRQDDELLPIIIISGHGTRDLALASARAGAYGFLAKPFSSEQLILEITQAFETARLRRELAQNLEDSRDEGWIDGSASMAWIRQNFAQIASGQARVLITGPRGSGTSELAARIHRSSSRKRGPFIVLPCRSDWDERTARDLFFGVERLDDGTPRRIGVLEKAEGGTLILDHIQRLSPSAQKLLVRPLHSGRFLREKGRGEVEFSVRIISILSEEYRGESSIPEPAPDPHISPAKWTAHASTFLNLDLLSRLAVEIVQLPALYERREDIPALAQFLAQKAARRRHWPERNLSESLLDRLQGMNWAGGLWELDNLVERIVGYYAGSTDAPIGPEALQSLQENGGQNLDIYEARFQMPLKEAREDMERAYFSFHLERLGHNITQIARFSGMERTALHRKLRLLGLRGTRENVSPGPGEPETVKDTTEYGHRSGESII